MKVSKTLAKIGATASSLYWVTAVKAQEATSELDEYLPDDPLDEEGDVLSVARRGIRLAILLAALVCVAVLVGAGYSYITAAGDEQKVEKATKTLTYAIVGLVICFIAVILVEFVLNNLLQDPTAQLLRLYV